MTSKISLKKWAALTVQTSTSKRDCVTAANNNNLFSKSSIAKSLRKKKYSPKLFNLCKDHSRIDFRSILLRLRESPTDAKFISNNFNMPLHELVCCTNVPLSVIKAVYLANPLAISSKGQLGCTPLHQAARFSTKEIIQFLIHSLMEDQQQNHNGIFVMQNQFGNTILHLACRYKDWEVTELLIKVESYALKISNSDGLKPLSYMTACERYAPFIRVALQSERKENQSWVQFQFSLPLDVRNAVEEYLAKARSLIKIDHYDTRKKQNLDKNGGLDTFKWKLLHSCLSIVDCPTETILLALKLYPEQLSEWDEYGNHPLHIAAANTSMNNVKVDEYEMIFLCEPIKLSSSKNINSQTKEKNSTNLITLLAQNYPSIIGLRNGNGRYALSLAIESGKKWENGVREMCRMSFHTGVNPHTVKDDTTGLYLFMQAAIGKHACIDTIYNLFRQWPELSRFKEESND